MPKLPSRPSLILRPLICDLIAASIKLSARAGLGNVPSKFPTFDELLSHRRSRYQSLLQWCPWWISGHLEYARLSLELNDIPAAYVSAHAPLTLKAAGNDLGTAKQILGLCLLKRGAAEQAREYFNAARSTARGVLHDRISEDLAAAEMALGNYVAAVEYLDQVPGSRRSAEANTALEFARSRVGGGKGHE